MPILKLLLLIPQVAYAAWLWRMGNAYAELTDQGSTEKWVDQDAVPLSVVVPFRNESKRIEPLLHSLSRLKYPSDKLELIFVDDQSDDDTVSRIRQCVFDFDTQIVSSYSPGKKAALTEGISKAKYPWILTLDADVSFEPHLLHLLVPEIIQHPEVAMVCGRVRVHAEKAFSSAFQAMETDLLQVAAAGSLRKGKALLNTGACLLFRKAVWQEMGGYSAHAAASSGDDTFFLLQLNKQSKESVRACPAACVVTGPERGWRKVISQRLRWSAKVRRYERGYVWQVGFITGLSALAIFINWLLFFSMPGEWYFALLSSSFVIRYIPEVAMLKLAHDQHGVRKRVIMSLIYPHFLLLIALLSTFIRPSWKGRRVRV